MNLASFLFYNSVVHLHQVGCPVCRNYSWHQKQNGRIQLNKTVLTFFIFFLPWIPSTYSRIYASSAKYALKNLPRVSQIFFLYATTIKNIFSKVCPPSVFKQHQLSHSMRPSSVRVHSDLQKVSSNRSQNLSH